MRNLLRKSAVTNTALVVVVLRQVAVSSTASRLFGAVHPRNIADSFRWTGLYALWIAIAQEALAGDIFLYVKAHHVPRTSFLT